MKLYDRFIHLSGSVVGVFRAFWLIDAYWIAVVASIVGLIPFLITVQGPDIGAIAYYMPRGPMLIPLTQVDQPIASADGSRSFVEPVSEGLPGRGELCDIPFGTALA